MTLGDRIVIMKDGFIQQIGTPQEVFNHPYNLFVAGFIGAPQMNFFDAKLIKDDRKYAIELYGHVVELSEDKQTALAANNVPAQDITLGVRPEHITIGETGVASKIDVHELMGSSVHLHMNTHGKDIIAVVSTMDMTEAEVASMKAGTAISFDFGGHNCHLFNKDTGINLEA
jgi:multiple sugar transport system ATP-binding protein